MIEHDPRLSDVVARLRQAFDQAFAAPRPEAGPELENLLAVRIGEEHYAIRVRELVGLERRRPIVPLPMTSERLGFLGLVGLRGRLVPVFSLPLLLGYRHDSAGGRWLALVGRDEPTALTFDELEGSPRVPRDAFVPMERSEHAFVRESLSVPGAPRLVLDIPHVLSMIGGGASEAIPGRSEAR